MMLWGQQIDIRDVFEIRVLEGPDYTLDLLDLDKLDDAENHDMEQHLSE